MLDDAALGVEGDYIGGGEFGVIVQGLEGCGED